MPHSCLRRLLRLPSQLLLPLLMQPIASSCRCRHAAAAPRNRWPVSLHVASQQMSLVTITRMRPPTLPSSPHAALLQRSSRASHCIPHNHHERKRFTRTRWDEEHQRCRDRAQQLAAPAPRVHRRAFGASRVFACFQNQRGVFRSCGASPCSADPSAALACSTHEHRCVAAACCGVQRSFERAACAEADLLSK